MFTFCTVIYKEEVGLLRLQARSFARWVPPDLTHEILIAVNDRNAGSVTRDIEAFFPEYGQHAGKVRIIPTEKLLGKTSTQLLNRWQIRYPLLRGSRPKGGWRGNPGWLVQQALKLGFSRVAGGEYVVILDAKNAWTKDLQSIDFVCQDGRAKAEFWPFTGKNQKTWFPPSMKAVGATADAPLPEMTTSFLTPFPVHTEVLKQSLENIELNGRTLAEAFLLIQPPPTEFFIINASVIKSRGTLSAAFCEGLDLCAQFAARSTSAEIDEALNKMQAGRHKCVALHSVALRKLDHSQLHTLYQVLTNAELISDYQEFEEILPQCKRS